MSAIFLHDDELRLVTEAVRGAMQSHGPTGANAGLYTEVYNRLAHLQSIAHREIIEEGAATLITYNPAIETAVIALELATVQGPPAVVAKTLLTEAYETLLAILTVGSLDDGPL